MAECALTEKENVVYDLKNQDFFEFFKLKKVKVLGKGMAELIGKQAALTRGPLHVSSSSGRRVPPQTQHRSHGHVKLENVFVCGSDSAHLGDLGLAMEVTHPSRTILACKMGGTVEYWPPEKVNADEHTRIDSLQGE
ncbi:hypothetical protein RRG08_065710 [Elysia crispata]|uniref:Protein kinase domain-containing protein n=1 Tax=Elysia crispata TaxID=231223 RepID=A0AAE1B226_9GAST|nr:hypothetical protein RRG08_065710 [Elysia crispata]